MSPYFLRNGNIYGLPILHHNMESAALARRAFLELQPDCVAVELPTTMELKLLHAASRLPDIGLIIAEGTATMHYLCEPCDAAFEGLRSALEAGVAAHCIDLDVDDYPDIYEPLPDPYAITRVGHENYYNAYAQVSRTPVAADRERELHMAWRLKGLALCHDSVLFIAGMAHVARILTLVDHTSFPAFDAAERRSLRLCTLADSSCREVLGECGWLSSHYELWRRQPREALPNRQLLIYQLYKAAAERYRDATGNPFAHYHLRNIMKFARNYALTSGRLMPTLFQLLSSAKGCVDHNYAYETWLLATDYPHLHNIDNLEQLDITAEEIWGNSKIIRFHKKEPNRKKLHFQQRQKDQLGITFEPPGPFGFCSHQPEDAVIENFSSFLQSKGTQVLCEEGARTIPFTSSLEDGLDARETIRHWHAGTLYVKVLGKSPGGIGSVVVIFDEDESAQYPWCMTWHGEHDQESDMAFYASNIHDNIIGPGISRCRYGGLMMSYPPRRMWDIWHDPDYEVCRTKAEVLLMAAIDYSIKPFIVYVAEQPPRSYMKNFASRYGKKLVYIPIGQLSPITLNRIRTFHVLDSHNKRRIADEYIY